MSNEIIKKEESQILDPAIFSNEGPTGFEETNSETFKTPFVKILQALSPELNNNKSDFLKDAKQGQFCNTASKVCYDELDVIVLRVQHSLIGWKPNRGGLVGVYDKAMESKIVARVDGPKKFDKDGNDINDTISFTCVNANDHSDMFIISLSTASLKYAKSWASKLRMLKANGKTIGFSYAGVWSIHTMVDSNDKGDWYTIGNTPSFTRFITKDEFEQAITPALELLKKAETDYSQLNETQEKETDEVEY